MRRLDGRLQGDYRTLFRGTGVDVADLREYQPGDDLRHIDWNVTARIDITHVREYVEDREVTAWLLLDHSASMGFGPVERRKHLVLTEVAATLAQLLSRGGNRVGALFFDGRVRETIPPGNGRNQVLRILARMLRRAAAGRAGATTDLGVALRAALGILRRRSLVVLVSDFISEPGWEGLLSQLARRHDVVAIQVVDRREFELPAAGMIYVEDAETGEVRSSSTPTTRASSERLRAAGRRAAGRPRGRPPLGRARPVHGVDRRGPRARAVPDLPAAQAAAPMTELAAEPRADFAWPWMLLALVAVPLVVLWYRGCSASGRRGAHDLAALGLVAARAERAGWRRRLPPVLLLRRPGGAGRGPGAAGGHRAAAPPRGHGDPRLRRVGEHGRQGPRAEPDRRGEGRGAHVRAEAAVHRADGRRGVQRQRARHPGAHHGQGHGARRDRPPHPAGRHRARRAGCRRRSRRSSGGRCSSTAGPATRSSRAGRTSATTGRPR